MLGISGENLTMRLRKKAFKAMVEQEIGWFDEQHDALVCALGFFKYEALVLSRYEASVLGRYASEMKDQY